LLSETTPLLKDIARPNSLSGMFRAGRIIIVSAVVALFGVASAVLGFIAEATRLEVSAT
jgi:hypothetical protein